MKDETIVPEKARRGRPPKQEIVKETVPAQEATIDDSVVKVITETKPGVTAEVVKTDEYSLEIVRDYYGNIDPFYLSKRDPRYEYRFLRDEAKNLSMKTSNLLFAKGGWQIVPKSHLLRIGFKEDDPGFSPDGLYRKGDQVLCFMPKEIYLEKEKHKIERANSPMKQIKRMLKDGDSSVGKDIHQSMQGIQTQKQLGM